MNSIALPHFKHHPHSSLEDRLEYRQKKHFTSLAREVHERMTVALSTPRSPTPFAQWKTAVDTWSGH